MLPPSSLLYPSRSFKVQAFCLLQNLVRTTGRIDSIGSNGVEREEQLIEERKFNQCPAAVHWPVHEMVQKCCKCHGFYPSCCTYSRRQFCHGRCIVLTDGAYIYRAVIGYASKSILFFQASIPITDSEDKFPVLSNQRAERLFMGFIVSWRKRSYQGLADLEKGITVGLCDRLRLCCISDKRLGLIF